MVDTNNKIYFQHLDVARFIAAFMIVVVHSFEAFEGWFGKIEFLTNQETHSPTIFGKILTQFIGNFGVGVDVFFLISGFLITYILLEEKKLIGKINIFKFMIRRSLRIWPLYFLIILITPFVVNWVESPDIPNYLPTIFFINNFDILNTKTWIYPFSHFWSICVEEHFYLVWPFIIAFIPKRRLLLTFYIFILASILFRIYTVYTNDNAWFTLYLHTLSRIDVIVIGAIGAYYYSEKKFEINLGRPLRLILYSILILSLCIEPVVLWNSPFIAGFKKYFYTIIFAILLLDFNINQKFNHFLPKKSIIHYLGKVSYGIYMYSNVLLLIIIKKIMWVYEIKSALYFFIIVYVLSILIPIISYELIEKQFLRLNKYFRVIKTER